MRLGDYFRNHPQARLICGVALLSGAFAWDVNRLLTSIHQLPSGAETRTVLLGVGVAIVFSAWTAWLQHRWAQGRALNTWVNSSVLLGLVPIAVAHPRHGPAVQSGKFFQFSLAFSVIAIGLAIPFVVMRWAQRRRETSAGSDGVDRSGHEDGRADHPRQTR